MLLNFITAAIYHALSLTKWRAMFSQREQKNNSKKSRSEMKSLDKIISRINNKNTGHKDN